VYKKTAQEKFPTLKKFPDDAPASDVHSTREVKMDTDYKSVDNPDISVPPEQRKGLQIWGKLCPNIYGIDGDPEVQDREGPQAHWLCACVCNAQVA
jgi:hypothetical protein